MSPKDSIPVLVILVHANNDATFLLRPQVNALLAKDRRNYSHDLSIQRYAVAPLSHNAGVVGWVPNTDTLHQLIRDYRDTRTVSDRCCLTSFPQGTAMQLVTSKMVSLLTRVKRVAGFALLSHGRTPSVMVQWRCVS